ncbi:MAG: RnfABCDGE type electron transport complex subunit G [Pseudomonadota bacterium]
MTDPNHTPQKESLACLMTPIMVIVLIASGAATLLAVVKEATKDAIAAAELAETEKGVKLVLPEGASVDVTKTATTTVGGKELTLYAGTDANGKVTSLAVKTYTETGYSGFIGVMVGFSPLDDPATLKVTRTYVLSHSETPGLGAKITACQESKDATECAGRFWTRYRDLPVDGAVLKVDKDGGQIQSLTSATISTRAVTGAVLEAGEHVKEHREAILADLEAALKGGVQ